MSTDNELLVTCLFDDVLNNGNLDIIDDLVAADGVDWGTSPIGVSGGTAGFKQAVSALRNAIPDLHFTVEEIITAGDRVVVRWTVQGTLEHELAGIPPTNRQMRVTGIVIYRISRGKIQESWGNWDALGMMVMLGAIPESAVPKLKLR